MTGWFSPRRSVLLVVSLLSACAATSAAPPSQTEPRVAISAYLQGQFAASQGALDMAAAQFLRAHNADPTDVSLHDQAFIAALLAGRANAASLAAGLPTNQVALLTLVNDAVLEGRWAQAVKRAEALPDQNITRVLKPFLLAWAQQGAGDTNAALAALRPLTQQRATQALATLNMAMIDDLAGRKDQADRNYATAAAAFGPASLDLARTFASWDARQGRRDEALGVLAGLGNNGEMGLAQPGLVREVAKPVIRNAADGIAAVYRFTALAVRQQNHGSTSLVLLRLALNVRPDDTMSRLALSEIYGANGQAALALAALDNVPKSDPLYDAVQLRRALYMVALHNSRDALVIMRGLVTSFPKLAEPAVVLGDTLRAEKNFPEAVKAYDLAIARTPNPGPDAWILFFDRGIALDRSGHWSEAEKDFRNALKLSPNQPDVLNYLGYSLADQGRDLPEARRMIEKALAGMPNDGAIIDSLGWVTLKQGDVTGAVRYLEHAVSLMPEDPTINGHLGDAYLAAGRRLEAAFQWQRALDLNPSPKEAEVLRKKLANDEKALREAAVPAKAQP